MSAADGGDHPNPGRRSAPMLVLPAGALALLAAGMAVWPNLMGEASLADFLLVSLFLGGGAAWLTGRAVAKSWGSYWKLVLYCILLAVAVRFCHFALFEDSMFVPVPALVEFVLLFSIASLGFRALRKRQMTQQYGWLYAADGRWAWHPRGDTPV